MTARALPVTAEGLAALTRRKPCPFMDHDLCARMNADGSAERLLVHRCCDGVGTVPDPPWVPTRGDWKVGDTALVVVKECLKPPLYINWGPLKSPGEPGWNFERRQVGVLTGTVTDVLPVAFEQSDTDPCILMFDGGGIVRTWLDPYWEEDVTDEPWTDGLEPGQVAIRLGPLTDCHVTEMVVWMTSRPSSGRRGITTKRGHKV